MRLTDAMVELDDRKYRDRNVLAALENGGRETRHRKTITNDDLRFTAWLCRSALNLLKEQKPIPCGEKIKAGDVMLDFYECGYCKNAIRKPWKYCPFCGKAVKWDE